MRNALIVFLSVLLIAACRSSPEQGSVAGPVVFIDAAGNRMTVAGATGTGSAQADANPAEAPEATTSTQASLPTKDFRGEGFVDSEDFEKELEERQSERFFVIPDGSGLRQTLPAGAIGAGTQRITAPVEPTTSAGWQVCRVILPLLELKPAARYDVSFPAMDEDSVVYGGYLLPAPPRSSRMTVWSYVRKGIRAEPVLARVDEQGRVLSIVNNMPTQSIPETGFRYASVGGNVSLNHFAGSARFALLDGARLQGKLPPACGLTSIAGGGSGLVTVQFSESGGQ